MPPRVAGNRLSSYCSISPHSDGIPVQISAQPTNGVTYFRAISNMAALPGDLKPYVPLFCNVVARYVSPATEILKLIS